MSTQPHSIHTDVKFPPLQRIDLRKPQQGFTVPKGVLHRTRAPVRSVVLMIENKGVVPTGD